MAEDQKALELLESSWSTEADQKTCDRIDRWINDRREKGPHDESFQQVLTRVALEHSNSWLRFAAIRAISVCPDRAGVVSTLLRCVSEYDHTMGDLYFPFEALDLLEQYKPLTFEQYDEIRRAMASMFKHDSAYEHYSYTLGWRGPFDKFMSFVPEPHRGALWPELVRDITDGDPERFAQALIWLHGYSMGSEVYSIEETLNYLLASEHPESATMMLAFVLHKLEEHEAFFRSENIDPERDTHEPAANTYHKYRALAKLATPAQWSQAEERLKRLQHEVGSPSGFFDHYEINRATS